MKACILPVRLVNGSMMICSRKVARKEPAGRGEEVHQVLYRLVAASGRLARVIEARVSDDKAVLARRSSDVSRAEPTSIRAAAPERQRPVSSRLQALLYLVEQPSAMSFVHQARRLRKRSWRRTGGPLKLDTGPDPVQNLPGCAHVLPEGGSGPAPRTK